MPSYTLPTLTEEPSSICGPNKGTKQQLWSLRALMSHTETCEACHPESRLAFEPQAVEATHEPHQQGCYRLLGCGTCNYLARN